LLVNPRRTGEGKGRVISFVLFWLNPNLSARRNVFAAGPNRPDRFGCDTHPDTGFLRMEYPPRMRLTNSASTEHGRETSLSKNVSARVSLVSFRGDTFRPVEHFKPIHFPEPLAKTLNRVACPFVLLQSWAVSFPTCGILSNAEAGGYFKAMIFGLLIDY